MKERGILFSAPMVRALLAGMKTQTRRVVKLPLKDRNFGCELAGNEIGAEEAQELCPHGAVGDRLWVRETFAKIIGQSGGWIGTDYRATYKHGDRLGDSFGIKKKWSPAIRQPRAASRITLEITDLRVERLQGISAADSIAEGIGSIRVSENDSRWINYRFPDCTKAQALGSAIASYRTLWESINGADSWAVNPWVWVVSFKRIGEMGASS